MTISSRIDNHHKAGKTVIITVSDRFDFNVRKEFRKAYSLPKEERIRHFVVDLHGATYLDSSALGMLLVLKDFAQEQLNASVALSKPSEHIKDLLELSNFNQLFDIE